MNRPSKLELARARVGELMDAVLADFRGGAKIVVIRIPGNDKADFCMTSDEIDETIALLQRTKPDRGPSVTPEVVAVKGAQDQILSPTHGVRFTAADLRDVFAVVNFIERDDLTPIIGFDSMTPSGAISQTASSIFSGRPPMLSKPPSPI